MQNHLLIIQMAVVNVVLEHRNTQVKGPDSDGLRRKESVIETRCALHAQLFSGSGHMAGVPGIQQLCFGQWAVSRRNKCRFQSEALLSRCEHTFHRKF